MHETPTPPPSAACSTCQILLHKISPQDAQEFDEKQASLDEKNSEKPVSLVHYKSECCGRYVCSICITKNPRFLTYCPFCPIKRPSQDQDTDREAKSEPPPYSPSKTPSSPPPYSSVTPRAVDPSKSLIHYLLPNDTIISISFQYSIPPTTIRSHNRLYSDSLLSGRSYIFIPRDQYSGPSLSPNPVQSEEENALKRFQIRTKCVEYEVAKVYLDESGWDLEKAVERWISDERWEVENGGRSSRVNMGKAGPSRTGSTGLRKGFFR